MKIVIKKGGLLWWKKFHFTVIAGNGEPVGRSRKFVTIGKAFHCIAILKEFFETGLGARYDIVRNLTIDEPYHFRVLNEECEILFWSENYHNRLDCLDTYSSIAKQFSSAEVIQTT